MKKTTFISEDFLLQTREARRLYHDYAEGMPIIDYHCHLPPEQIARDQRWENLTQIWLAGDHYKWRAMRANGVAERFCTGNATDWEKFEKWAETVPFVLRNPLYHWTHLELARYFGIADRLLASRTAKSIWKECNERIREPEFSARGLMKKSNVVLVCTTDDPIDSLEHHQALRKDKAFDVQVLPAWRPDRAMEVENPAAFKAWVDKLAAAAGLEVRSFGDFLQALRQRQDFFHQRGCRLSDHGLETAYAADYTEAEIGRIFKKARAGSAVSDGDVLKFKSAMLVEFGVMDHEKGWTQQYHFGALRSVNSRMLALAGPNTGFDTIGDFDIGRPLAKLLDRLDSRSQLPRTILYNLNPRDNAVLAAMTGNFQDGSVPGKIQYGTPWWFLDQKDGIERQIEDLSQFGLLGRFIGMLTDSRSFLSYPRHEYFRRILCNILGKDMAEGLIPADMELVGGLVRDISYRNAARYFGFDLP